MAPVHARAQNLRCMVVLKTTNTSTRSCRGSMWCPGKGLALRTPATTRINKINRTSANTSHTIAGTSRGDTLTRYLPWLFRVSGASWLAGRRVPKGWARLLLTCSSCQQSVRVSERATAMILGSVVLVRRIELWFVSLSLCIAAHRTRCHCHVYDPVINVASIHCGTSIWTTYAHDSSSRLPAANSHA